MKVTISSIILLLFIFLTSCSKDEISNDQSEEESEETTSPEELEEVYFSYNTPSFLGGFDEVWVIINDSSGELIDYKSINNLPLIEFNAVNGEAPELFTVTVLVVLDSNITDMFLLESFTNITKGSVWYENYAERATPSMTLTGNFDVTVNNIPDIRRLNIFQPTGRINFVEDSVLNEDDGSVTLQLEDVFLFDDNDCILSIYDTEDNLRYTRLAPEDNDVFNIDYADFLEFDTVFQTEIPSNARINIYTAGYQEENPNFYTTRGIAEFGFALDWNYFSDKFNIGYLDDFQKFKTEISIDFDDYTYGYIVNGAKVSNFSVLDKPSLEIVNENYQNFEFNSSIDFNRKKESWIYDNSDEATNTSVRTYWTFWSDDQIRSPIGDFPDEILEQYPTIGLDKLVIKGITLYTQSESYEAYTDIITNTLEDKTERIKEFITVNF